LEALIKESNSIYLANFSGINVEKMTELRDKFFKMGVKIQVAKNTLMKKAFNNIGITDLDPYLEGMNIFAFGLDNPALPARIMLDFVKEYELLKLKGCLFEGRLYGPDKIEMIRDLPSREQALAAVLGQLQVPLSQFIGVFDEIIRSFLAVLDAVIQEKSGAAA